LQLVRVYAILNIRLGTQEHFDLVELDVPDLK